MTNARLCAIPDEFEPAWEIGGPVQRAAVETPPAAVGLAPAPAEA
ncbi:MAG: hypothetical protein WDN45_02695 [Caulobacteraceae bacterium]